MVNGNIYAGVFLEYSRKYFARWTLFNKNGIVYAGTDDIRTDRSNLIKRGSCAVEKYAFNTFFLKP